MGSDGVQSVIEHSGNNGLLINYYCSNNKTDNDYFFDDIQEIKDKDNIEPIIEKKKIIRKAKKKGEIKENNIKNDPVYDKEKGGFSIDIDF